MKRLLILFILFYTLDLKAQAWQWVEKAGLNGTGNDYGQAIAIDSQKDVYVTGRCKNATTFGQGSYAQTPALHGQQDMFLAKYDGYSGRLIWVKRNGGIDADYGNGIIVDKQDNLFVTGYYTGNVNFGGVPVLGIGAIDFYIAKYDSSGTQLWIINSGTPASSIYSNAIAWNTDSTFCISGEFIGTLLIANDTINSVGNTDIFIACFDTSGVLKWLKRAGSAGIDQCPTIVCDSLGNVYIGGEFSSTASFDNINVTRTGGSGRDGFIAKYDINGNIIWVKTMGSLYIDRVFNLAIDNKNNVVSTGYFMGPITFYDASPITATHGGAEDFFIAKYSQNGNLIWAKTDGDSGFQSGGALAISKDGDIYFSGEAEGSFSFLGEPFTAIGTRDLFYSKLDTSGNLVWFKQVNAYFGGGYYPVNHAICIDHNDFTYYTGGFKLTSNFDSFTLTAAGSSEDAFFGKINSPLDFNFVSNDTILCLGDTLNISFIKHKSYQIVGVNSVNFISNNDSSIQISSNIIGANYYDILFFDGYDTIVVNGYFNVVTPSVLNLGNDTTLCSGDSVLLTVSNSFNNLTWNNGSTYSNYLVHNSGMYSVSALDSNACSVHDTIQINYFTQIDPLSFNTANFCEGDSLLINATTSAFYEYLWGNGDTTNQTYVNQAGWFSVSLKDENNCIYNDSVLININPSPNNFLGNDTLVCDSILFIIQTNQNFPNYLWNTGASSFQITPDTSGFFILSVIDFNSCTGSDSILVSYQICNGIQTITETDLFHIVSYTNSNMVINSNDKFLISIFTSDGKECLNLNLIKGINQFTFHLSAGLYFIHATSKEYIQSTKIFVE